MDFKFAVLLFVVAKLSASNPVGTPCICQRQFEPVCGSNGETFNNKCLLDCKASTNSDITLAKYGPCEQINTGICGCSLDYIPVCGNDGKTYPNTCHVSCKILENSSLDVAYDGVCKEEIPQANLCTCSNNYKPVCGSDGITYDNDCLLNCATANNPRLGIAYFTRCRTNPLLRDNVKVATPNIQ